MDITKYNDDIQKLMRIVEENCEVDAELALQCCDELIEYGQRTEDHALVGYGYYYRSVVFYVLNKGNDFFEAVSLALSELALTDEWAYMARCYNFLGIAAVSRGNSALSLDYYLNAIKYCERADLEAFSAKVQVNIGVLNIVSCHYTHAIESLQSAYDKYYLQKDTPHYDKIMVCILQNLAKGYVCKGELEKAKDCFSKIYKYHFSQMDTYTMVTVYCTEVMYYHLTGETEACEERIARVDRATNSNMPVLDLFEDYYDYCKVLLQRGNEKEFWNIIHTMEPMLVSVGIAHLQMRLQNLKIKAYRQKGQTALYLHATAAFYELVESAEVENRAMMNNTINLRRNLERLNREKAEIEAKNEMLLLKSETDALTGLANRFRLNDFSEEAFQRAIENGTSLTVEILDMDSFKDYNDTYGHQRGDECIQRVAKAMKSMEEFGAFTARYGGDEFILIYEGISKEQAINYAATLRQRVLDLGIVHESSKVASVVSISQGLCWDIPMEGNRMWDYLHAADDMLYRVKRNKRNNFCVGNLKETLEDIVMSHM